MTEAGFKYYFDKFNSLASSNSDSARPIISDEVKKTCMDAKDFVGCVEALSGSSLSTNSNNIEVLKKALKRLPSRLENTNLRDFTANTQFLNDAIADIEEGSLKTDYEYFVLAEARTISDMLDALQSAWSNRIHNGTFRSQYSKSYFCPVLRGGVAAFNAAAGQGSPYTVVFSSHTTKRGLLAIKREECSPQEYKMINAIEKRVADALVSPEEKQAQLDKEKREKELCEMAPWQRYLEENPGMKQWAEANPGPAEAKKKKFLANPKNQTTCQAQGNKD